MKPLSSSPDRGSFQRSSDRLRDADPEEAKALDELFSSWRDQKLAQEQDPEWRKNNMEADLRASDEMVARVRASNVYAQNLYAAMCNRSFQKIDVVEILRDSTWSCSWRYAGGIVAEMKGEGDYIDWYCSGISGESPDLPEDADPETREMFQEVQQYVGEGQVTDQIRQDLLALGWSVLPDDLDEV